MHNIHPPQAEVERQLPWFALQTRAGRERTCLRALEAKGYEVFLPLSKQRRRRPDRIQETCDPIFPGYLFCRFDPNRRLPVVQTPTVIDVLRVGRQPSAIPDFEVEALMRAQDAGLRRTARSYFYSGQPVEIVSGPLRGVTGRVVSADQLSQLIVNVSLLHRSVVVTVDPAWVWPTTSLGYLPDCDNRRTLSA